MAFQRCDLDWSPGTRTVLESRKSPLFEAAQPLTYAQPPRAHATRYRGNRLTRGCQKHHTRSPVPASLAALVPRNLLERFSFSPTQPKCHHHPFQPPRPLYQNFEVAALVTGPRSRITD